MALINCPECGTQTSDMAAQCVKCGYPICKPETVEAKPVAPTHWDAPSAQSAPSQTVIINQSKSNGTGTAGFVFALLSLFFCWVPVVGWIVWFLGLLLSFIGMFKSPRGLAVVGFILSIIDLIILIAVIGAIAGAASMFL